MAKRLIKAAQIALRGRPLHGPQDKWKPVFIVGSGRSGTTLIRSILCSHSDIYIPPETYFLKSLVKEFRRYSRLPWSALLRILLGRIEFYQKFDSSDISVAELFRRIVDTEEERQTLSFVISSFYMYHAQCYKPNAIRWGDKTPSNTYAMQDLFEVFPDACFIHMIRDGRDVVNSYLNMDRYKIIEDAAERWMSSVAAARSFGERNDCRYIEVRYEELVREPRKTVKRLCMFLDLEYSDDLIADNRSGVAIMPDIDIMDHLSNVSKPISDVSVGKWKDLPSEERHRLNEILETSLIDLGYNDSLASYPIREPREGF